MIPSDHYLSNIQNAIQQRESFVENTNAFRLYNGFYEGLPGLVIDRYGGTVVISNHGEPGSVSDIIPMIAQKSAKIVGKPVPDIAGTITKIMNVVWVEDDVATEKKKHHVSVKLYNYTPKTQKLHVHMVLPFDKVDEKTLKLQPEEVRDGTKVTWKIDKIASTDMFELAFDLKGVDADEYDDNELYVSGIDPASVIGADVLPGDWDLEHVKITEGVAEPDESAENGEVDYDEGAEVIGDEE